MRTLFRHLLALLVGLPSCSPRPPQTPLKVTYSTTYEPGLSWAAVHAKPDQTLRVGSRTFKNVVGSEPYHIQVSATLVAFFMDENDFDRILVLCNLSTGEVTRITGDWTGFGHHIGSTQPELRVTIRQSGNKILVRCPSDYFIRTAEVDLAKHVQIRSEIVPIRR